MTYENAPATKMLATHCAACGRALVDAKSVEAGMGPDCRERFGTDVVVSETARNEANEIVFKLARGGLSRKDARPLFARLAALGFVVLAARVAKRFRSKLDAALTDEQIATLRAEYSALRAEFCYDSCSPKEFNALVINALGESAGPADYVAAAKTVECKCAACAGSGVYNAPSHDRDCYRCAGKGFQNFEDVRRNRAYDKHRAAARSATSAA